MKTKLIIYIVILVLAITGLGVAIYFLNKDRPDIPIPTQETCVLTLKVNDESLGRIETLSGVYYKNREVELKASAINNSTFMGWYLNEELLSTDASYNFLVKEDVVIIAKFKGEEMYTKEELLNLIKTVDFSQDFNNIVYYYTRDFEGIKLEFDFSFNLITPDFTKYKGNDILIDSTFLTAYLNLDNTFKSAKLNCYKKSTNENFSIDLTETEVNNLISILNYNNDIFPYLISDSTNTIKSTVELLTNQFIENGVKICNIASLYKFEVNSNIEVYDSLQPLRLSSENIKVVVLYEVDDTVPKDPNLDEDGDYVINATELFELKGIISYYVNNSNLDFQNFLMFPVIEEPYYNDRRMIFYNSNGGSIERPNEIYWESFNQAISELNFNDSSKIQKVELKSDLNTTLNNLKSIYTNKAEQINETASADEYGQIRGTCVINLASLFNFYDISGNLITNVKFNVSVSYTINRGGG